LARALAVEAEFGLALSVFKAIDPTLVREKKAQTQTAALSQAKMLLDELTGIIGEGQIKSLAMIMRHPIDYFSFDSLFLRQPTSLRPF
jgi:hypothetical protein